jgi:sialate O-acetylesterase
MKSKAYPRFIVAASLFGILSCARSEVRLPALFSDGMVLQQNIHAPIWGWADEGEEVSVTFRGKTEKAKPVKGKWTVKLGALKAGGPDELVIQGKNRIEIKNVLVGEVWLASGQSNMEWPLKSSFEPAHHIAACANPKIRLFLVVKARANSPQEDVKGQWKECNPESVPAFSAVAYYFGRSLQEARNVPVGLIGTYWGGSPAEVWMSQQALESNPEYKQDILDTYTEAVKKAEASSDKKQMPGWKPTELYNAMIAPLVGYAIKGAIWYQGESNAGRADQYRRLFPDMIRNWRKDWGQGDFTFIAVQLAPWDPKRTMEQIAEKPAESGWAELREAQLLTTKVLPKVGMVVITDVGDKNDIHPTKKKPFGERLALAARAIAYGEKIEYSGPLYNGKISVKNGQAILGFDHTDGGLEARDGALKGFAICGDDKKFVWGKAEIRDNKVVVSSPEVPQPVAVRYGWADFPIVNLWNKAGLPASPFRTDDFPMITAKKK